MTVPKPRIRAVIIGASIGGLATAIALARSGQRSVVLEARTEVEPTTTGGTRLGPNVTKILNKWGYKERLNEIGCVSRLIGVRNARSGEGFGWHSWDEGLIKDAQGDFTFTMHGRFLKFLHDIATELGVELRYGTKVVAVDIAGRNVTLEDGEVLKGDILVGADGENGITRPLFDRDTDQEPEYLANAYSAIIPIEKIMANPLTSWVLQEEGQMSAWFGDRKSVLGWQTGADDYAIFAYGPPDSEPTGWEGPTDGTKDILMDLFDDAEPSLRALLDMAPDPHVLKIEHRVPHLHDWWHPDGPLVLVGHAAQPIVPGAVREASINFEDGVTLGCLFKYFRRPGQISDLLEAYEDIRRKRDIQAYWTELAELYFHTMPFEESATRDQAMRENRDTNRSIFGVRLTDDGPLDVPEWRQIVDQFAFNAELSVDEWWQRTGKLIERGKSGTFVDGPPLQVRVKQSTS